MVILDLITHWLGEVELISLIAMLDAAITQRGNVRNEEWGLIRIYYRVGCSGLRLHFPL